MDKIQGLAGQALGAIPLPVILHMTSNQEPYNLELKLTELLEMLAAGNIAIVDLIQILRQGQPFKSTCETRPTLPAVD